MTIPEHGTRQEAADGGEPPTPTDARAQIAALEERLAAAETADRVFARDSLASYLDREGVAYERWNDFDDVRAALGIAGGTAREDAS